MQRFHAKRNFIDRKKPVDATFLAHSVGYGTIC